jgi:hypothetical protein
MSDEFDLIFSYSRKQAIEDGVLIDVTDTAKEAGFKWPVAVTSTVWNQYIIPHEDIVSAGQSKEGRLWDVLNVLRIASKKNGTEVFFNSTFFMENDRHEVVRLKAVSGPGDEGEPVITIMLPEED